MQLIGMLDSPGVRLDQAALTSAATWHVMHSMLPELARPEDHPSLPPRLALQVLCRTTSS